MRKLVRKIVKRTGIRVKLLGGFMIVAVFAGVAGGIGVFTSKGLITVLSSLSEENTPLVTASYNVKFLVSEINSTVNAISATTSSTKELEEKLNELTGELNLWLDIIAKDTSSKEFLDSPSGRLYQKRNLEIQKGAVGQHVIDLLNPVRSSAHNLIGLASGLLGVQTRYLTYNVKVDGNYKPAGQLMYVAMAEQIDWMQKLNGAVFSESKFTGQRRGDKMLSDKVTSQIRTNDPALKKIIEKHQKLQKKVFKRASQVWHEDNFEKRIKLAKRVSSTNNQLIGSFVRLANKLHSTQEALAKQRDTFAGIMVNSTTQIHNSAQAMVTYAETQAFKGAKAAAESKTTAQDQMNLVIGTTMFCVIAALILGMLISGHIVKNLAQIINALQKEADQVTGAAHELTLASSKMATGAQEQAASLEQTTASLEQINSSAKENSHGAEDASKLVGTAVENINRCASTMDNILSAMAEVKTSSTKMSNIVETISGISFQTNILSLNAAVEASRAGEQGRGFAVVAEEVRELAGQVAKSANETAGLIGENSDRTDASLKLINGAEQQVKETSDSMRQLLDIIQHILEKSSSQAGEVGEISRTTGHLEDSVANNAAVAEETSGSAVALEHGAVAMGDIIDRLDCFIKGKVPRSEQAR